jgi:hypothetical protein
MYQSRSLLQEWVFGGPAMRRGPLWIVEPPRSTGERMSVNDPEQTVGLLRCRRSTDQTSRRLREQRNVHDPPGDWLLNHVVRA